MKTWKIQVINSNGVEIVHSIVQQDKYPTVIVDKNTMCCMNIVTSTCNTIIIDEFQPGHLN